MDLTRKKILITGANGLVGLPAVQRCLNEEPRHVYAVDIHFGKELKYLAEKHKNRLTLIEADLTDFGNCKKLFENDINIVFHLAGIKGNPLRAKNNPADYFFPMVMFNTNIIKAAFDAKVEWFVYTSSVGVYQPADIMTEDDVWKTQPSQNDWYPGWAKRCGELALETLQKQYGWNRFTIIRPANIFGANDNFSPDATVIASSVYKMFNDGDTITCWGDGTPRRDFVFSDDVAKALIDSVRKEINDIVNFGSGNAVSIKEMLETMCEVYEEIFGVKKTIVYDTSKPNGDLHRCLSIERQTKYDLLPNTPFRKGIMKTILGYKRKNREFSTLLEDGYYVGHISELIDDYDEFNEMITEAAKFDMDPKYYQYRHQVDQSGIPDVYPWEVFIDQDQVEKRKLEVKLKRLRVVQQWYYSSNIPSVNWYFTDLTKSFISEIYPQILPTGENFSRLEQFTIYKKDDFIVMHEDGLNPGRLCVILIYFTEPNLYTPDSGGELVIKKKNNELLSLAPTKGNYVILDFTKNNISHAVNSVKNNDFVRKAYLSFIYDLFERDKK